MASQDEQGWTADGDAPPRATGRGARSRMQVDPIHAAEREYGDREASEDRELSDDERLEMLRESLVQSMLPDLPRIRGFHVCWLTTTNKSDTLAWRKRLGYTLIRAEEVPSWDGITVQGGEFQGVIGVNEMVAAKIPLSLYNKYVRALHHTMPLEQEEKLRAQVNLMKESAREMKAGIHEEEGMADLVQRATPMQELRE